MADPVTEERMPFKFGRMLQSEVSPGRASADLNGRAAHENLNNPVLSGTPEFPIAFLTKKGMP
jgi:hypothetical protein